MNDHLAFALLVVLPYVAVATLVGASFWRYRRLPFTYSALSTQFLENHHQFWASLAFHWGVLLVLGGHLVAFLVPGQILAWNADPYRLAILEITAMVGGLLALAGIAGYIARLIFHPRVRVVTSRMDVVLLALLAGQILTGIIIALWYPWGSSWYAAVMAPYLWSLVTLSPDAGAVAAMPLLVQTHVLGAWLLIIIFPFTRLVHLLVAPFSYAFWKQQHQRWYADRRLVRTGGRATTRTQARS